MVEIINPFTKGKTKVADERLDYYTELGYIVPAPEVAKPSKPEKTEKPAKAPAKKTAKKTASKK